MCVPRVGVRPLARRSYLRQFPSKHYSCDGRDPLMYVNVLLLSLQFKAALQYLLSDPAAAPYRVPPRPTPSGISKRVTPKTGPSSPTPEESLLIVR